jgi:hypothetical protein
MHVCSLHALRSGAELMGWYKTNDTILSLPYEKWPSAT